MGQFRSVPDSALCIHSCPQRHSRISAEVSQTSTCVMAQLTVAEATQAANSAEAKIPQRMTMARFTEISPFHI